MSYYNTTHEADTLPYRIKAAKQDDQIMEFFRDHPFDSFTPATIWKKLFTPQTPLDSAKRSITNLTKAGLLVKTEQKEEGIYGRPNFKWRLKHKHAYELTLF